MVNFKQSYTPVQIRLTTYMDVIVTSGENDPTAEDSDPIRNDIYGKFIN